MPYTIPATYAYKLVLQLFQGFWLVSRFFARFVALDQVFRVVFRCFNRVALNLSRFGQLLLNHSFSFALRSVPLNAIAFLKLLSHESLPKVSTLITVKTCRLESDLSKDGMQPQGGVASRYRDLPKPDRDTVHSVPACSESAWGDRAGCQNWEAWVESV